MFQFNIFGQIFNKILRIEEWIKQAVNAWSQAYKAIIDNMYPVDV